VGQSLPYPLRHVQAVEADMFPGNDMSELVRAEIGQCARRSAGISPMDDPAALKVGAAQKGTAGKTGIPSEAPTFGLWKKEQALSPGVVGHIEPVLAALGLEDRALQQPFAGPQKPPSAGGPEWAAR